MPLYIEMPKLADTMTDGTLVKWRKNLGDKVSTGDIVAEVETDKATMEMESFDDGILHEYLVKVGEKVPTGARIAVLSRKGEKAPAPGTLPASAPAKARARPRLTPLPLPLLRHLHHTLQNPPPSQKVAALKVSSGAQNRRRTRRLPATHHRLLPGAASLPRTC
jgi:pyruvate dehydrogenase E2 component (dihydrolipoamide acetyltransferase)